MTNFCIGKPNSLSKSCSSSGSMARQFSQNSFILLHFLVKSNFKIAWKQQHLLYSTWNNKPKRYKYNCSKRPALLCKNLNELLLSNSNNLRKEILCNVLYAYILFIRMWEIAIVFKTVFFCLPNTNVYQDKIFKFNVF